MSFDQAQSSSKGGNPFMPVKKTQSAPQKSHEDSIGFKNFREFFQGHEAKLDEIALLEIPKYSRVRIVGQGSFGVAVLYERKMDGSRLVVKQINLSELTQAEREMAMNEVEVFSKLQHPHIISYYDSFIRNDVLLIEMEYAEGGTLAQLIGERTSNDRFSERQILSIFEQITSAIGYMHSQSILHRDLKTANIFLCHSGVVKVGDFGISKIVDTKVHAQTILGTPYYFSPEMCEGKEYDEKSDIWALGCILCEVCCLKKAFTSRNLSELLTKIMATQYNPIPSGYSDSLRNLLKLLLKLDPIDRPPAKEILQYWIPYIYRKLGKDNGYEYINSSTQSISEDLPGATMETLTKNASYLNKSTATLETDPPTERSVLYQLKSFGANFSMLPIQLPATEKVVCVSASDSHFIAVLFDGACYTWGEGSKGQLGHNLVEAWKHIPVKVEDLSRYVVVGACAGDGFSIFWTDLGVAFSCGDNTFGCLGHGDDVSSLVPKRIQRLDNVRVVKVTCGVQHVLCLTADGDIYKWGTSKDGALGFGNSTTLMRTPNRLLSSQLMHNIRDIKCGPDCSFIINKLGEVYCCGSNQSNKLGFGKNVDKISAFRKITVLGSTKIIDLSASAKHTVFIIEGGYVITIGSNEDGQRGSLLDAKAEHGPSLMRSLERRFITSVKTFPTYTLAVTDDNHLLFWGTRCGIKMQNSGESEEAEDTKTDLQTLGNSTTAFTNFLASVYKSETITSPIEILALFSSKEELTKGHYARIQDVIPLIYSVLVLVETTCPLAD